MPRTPLAICDMEILAPPLPNPGYTPEQGKTLIKIHLIVKSHTTVAQHPAIGMYYLIFSKLSLLMFEHELTPLHTIMSKGRRRPPPSLEYSSKLISLYVGHFTGFFLFFSCGLFFKNIFDVAAFFGSYGGLFGLAPPPPSNFFKIYFIIIVHFFNIVGGGKK